MPNWKIAVLLIGVASSPERRAMVVNPFSGTAVSATINRDPWSPAVLNVRDAERGKRVYYVWPRKGE